MIKLRFSGIVRSVVGYRVTGVLGEPIGPILKG
jgi:hypothetical protein